MSAPTLLERLRVAASDAKQRAVHSWRELAALLNGAAAALDTVPACDCGTTDGFHEISCTQSKYYAALRR